jgi:hypothetical protein
MDIRKEDIPGVAKHADIVLDVKGELKVAHPILPFVPVGWKDRVVEEDLEAVEVGSKPV